MEGAVLALVRVVVEVLSHGDMLTSLKAKGAAGPSVTLDGTSSWEWHS